MDRKMVAALVLLLLLFPSASLVLSEDVERVTSGALSVRVIPAELCLEDEDFPLLAPKNMSDLLGLEEMWAMGYNGSGVTVAVLDTGIDNTHPELSGQVAYNKSFVSATDDGMDREGHGTVVAGIIASRGAGDGRYAGVAPGATLMNIKVMNASGEGYLEWVIDGIDHAVGQGADILSVSLGADPSGWSYVEDTVSDAWESGVAVVVASGNEGPNYDTVDTPGDVLEAVTVGSCSLDLYMLSFSSAGPTASQGLCKPEVVAPGAYLIGPASSHGSYEDTFMYNGSKYAVLSGTSVSTPVISGMFALLIEATGADINAIKVALMQSARDLGHTQYRQGYGVPSAYGAYTLLTDPEWEPVLFLPSEMPLEPLEKDDVYDYPIAVIAGKTYEDAYFESDLPIILPEIEDELYGHYVLEIEPDIYNTESNLPSKGYIRLMSEDGDILAEMELEIVVATALSVISLAVVAVFIIGMAGIAAFMFFSVIKRGKKGKDLGCDPLKDPTCKVDLGCDPLTDPTCQLVLES